MSIVDAGRGWRPSIGTDVCIVGGGAAGITLAMELAARGLDSVVLEGGGREPSEDSQSLYAGESTGIPYDLIGRRLRFFGGSTNHWTGICRPLDPHDVVSSSSVPLSGWPITYEEIAAHYPKAEQICELPGDGWDAATWLESHATSVLPTDAELFETAIFRNSPPTRFATRYGVDLEASSSATVVLNANVVGLGLHDRTVTSVHVVTPDGDAFDVRPRRVVLAMGGIENARFLLNVAPTLPQGPHLDWVGSCFMEHPLYYRRLVLLSSESVLRDLTGYLPPLPGPPARQYWATLATTSSVRQRDGLLGCTARCTSIFDQGAIERLPPAEMSGVASLVRFAHLGTADRLLSIELWTEQAPDRRNRVVLAQQRDRLGARRTRLEWDIRPFDRESASRSAALLGQELARIGLGRVCELDGDLEEQVMLPGSHHMGTTRMSASPDGGVVDETSRMHGTTNLYVAGSSVFPTGGYANPTITVVALALRLAEHLAST